MEVISTNIGKKKEVIFQGRSVFTGIYKYPVHQPLILGDEDVLDDAVVDRRFHGGVDKACYLYAADHYNFWKGLYSELDWEYGMFGENLTVSGLDEEQIYIGDIYKLGTAVVQVTQPRQPCFKLGIRLQHPKAVNEFVKAEKPGAYVRVLQKGEVNKNDGFILQSRGSCTKYTLKDIFHLLYHAKNSVSAVKEAAVIPELAARCRNDLLKKAGLQQ